MIRQLYENSEYKNILHDIDGVYIPLDLSWNSIAVTLSGGADSALLTYLLAEIIQKNNLPIKVHSISHIRCWKTKPWQEDIANKVYENITNRFPNVNWQRHINFISPDLEYSSIGPTIVDEYGKSNSGDVIEIRSYAEYVGHKYSIDAYYNSVTHNPPVNLNYKMDHRDIPETEDNFRYTICKHMGALAIHPFRFVNKSWVYKQYVDKRLLELFEMTRSCESTFTEIDYKNYQQGQFIPVCNKCFWCLERQWAIDQYVC